MTLLVWLSLALAVTPQEVVELEIARAPVHAFSEALSDPSVDIRAQAVRAVGRLRQADSLPALQVARHDDEAQVRAAAAASLAWTPNSAAEIRSWLDSLPPLTPGGGALGPHDVRPTLLRALGDQGEAADIPTLVAALGCARPLAIAAADALADLARRDLDVQAAVPALIAALGRLDSAVSEAAAHALYRIKPAERWSVLLAATLPKLSSGPARAWLLRAASPGLGPRQRTSLLLDCLTDSDGRVVATAWQILGTLDAPPSGLDKLPVPEDPQAAYSRSLALAAPTEPIRDPVQVALTSDRAPERTAAVVALRALEPDADTVLGLLEAADPSVRRGAIEMLTPHSSSATVSAALLQHAAVERDVHVLIALLQHLATTTGQGDISGSQLAPVLELYRDHPSPAVRAEVRTLATRAGLTLKVASQPHPTVDLEAALRIQGATLNTTRGPVRVVLRPDIAPLTVSRFAERAEAGFYEGVVFHRLVPGFVVQGGDPRGDGWGAPAELLVDEVSAVRFEQGALGLARGQRDTGGTQFFFSLAPTPHLTGDYTWFGEVVQGGWVVRNLTPDDKVVSVTIERSRP